MFTISGSLDCNEEHLTSSGWFRTESPQLHERLFITRLLHTLHDVSVKRPAGEAEPNYDEIKKQLSAQRANFSDLRTYYHPKCPGAVIQNSFESIGVTDEAIVAAFFDDRFKALAMPGLQSDKLRNRFTHAHGKQSSHYAVEWGGRRISASVVEHQRDATNFFYEARIDDPYIEFFGHSKEQCYPIYAEMKMDTRLI